MIPRRITAAACPHATSSMSCLPGRLGRGCVLAGGGDDPAPDHGVRRRARRRTARPSPPRSRPGAWLLQGAGRHRGTSDPPIVVMRRPPAYATIRCGPASPARPGRASIAGHVRLNPRPVRDRASRKEGLDGRTARDQPGTDHRLARPLSRGGPRRPEGGCRERPERRRGDGPPRPARAEQVRRAEDRAAHPGLPAPVRRRDADRPARGRRPQHLAGRAGLDRRHAHPPDAPQRLPGPQPGRQGGGGGRGPPEDDGRQGAGAP